MGGDGLTKYGVRDVIRHVLAQSVAYMTNMILFQCIV